MPKRSNDWQALIFVVEHHLAARSTDAVVTESAMISDFLTGNLTEVDVAVRGTVNGHTVTVGIECVDLSRPADRGWVQKMQGKHAYLPTNVVVLASKSGFTPKAAELASKLNMVTVTVGEPIEIASARVAAKLDSVWVQLVEFIVDWAGFVLKSPTTDEQVRVRVPPKSAVYDANGREVSNADDFVHDHVNHPRMFEKDGLDLARYKESGDYPLSILISFDDEEEPRYLHSTSQNAFRRIEAIGVKGTTRIGVSTVPLSHAEIRGVGCAWGRGNIDGRDALFVTVESAEGATVSLRLDPQGKEATTQSDVNAPRSEGDRRPGA